MTDDKSLDDLLKTIVLYAHAEKTREEAKKALEAHINQVRDKVTRVELIDENGRTVLVSPGEKKVTLSFQDDNRTLKIFVDEAVSQMEKNIV